MPPSVCVIILNWNGLQDTINCLASLRETTYRHYEVIVVDNGSDGDDAGVLREQFGPYVHVVENEHNLGYAEGSNVGISYAVRTFQPEYIALLDNDTIVDPNWLAELVEPLSADRSEVLAATCSLIRDRSNPDTIRYGGDGKMNIFGQTTASTRIEPEMTVRTFAGPSCLLRRSALDRLGSPFCSEFFIYYNDIDLSWRLNSAGYKLRFVPSSVVFHTESASARSTEIRDRNAILKARNKYLIFFRNLPRAKFLLVLPLLLGFDLFVGMGYLLVRRDSRLLRAKLKGMAQFVGVAGEVEQPGGGALSYLDKRPYLDKLG
jgi:GT2 family glycosyltransferase